MAGSILGASVRRVEDPRFITGSGTYLPNQVVGDALWMVPVRSALPHAHITSIDVDEAKAAPGVIRVYTAGDLDVQAMPVDAPGGPEAARRPLIATDRVRFVGEVVAVVVAETPLAAADAADLVWPDYEPLPAVATPEQAMAADAPLLFEDLGTNLLFDVGTESEDVLAGAEVVIRTRVANQRIAAIPLETNGALARPRDDGGIDIWLGSQSPFGARRALAVALAIDSDRIHVKVPDMGGGFGAKIPTYPEHALAAAIALDLQRPVRWQETRTENLQAMAHGRTQVHDVEMGASRDGRITGLRVSVVQDGGAYPLFGSFLPAFTRRVASGPYAIPKIDFRWKTVLTNTTPVHAYRGAGRPEATMTLERCLDQLAIELDMDPAEVRRRNFVPPEAFPYISATGERYDSGDYEAALEMALNRASYHDLRREQAERREAGDRWQLGIGIASYIEITAGANRKDWGAVEVHPDGTAVVSSGAASHGHSHETTFAQIAAQVLKMPLEKVRYIQADTDFVVRGGGTMASRSMQMAGSAVLEAGRSLIEKARLIVAHAAEASPNDVVRLDDGSIGIAGVPDTFRTLAEIAEIAADPANLPAGMEPGLRADDLYEQAEATVPFGSHVSVVEVDTETGDVRVRRHIACDDCGTIFSRMVVDGQVHGGVAQGIGQALLEQVRYDADANPLTGNLAGYLVPAASNIPSIEIEHTETPTDQNDLGAKGIGEAGTVGATPAVVGAVHDALAPLGIRQIDMPLTPSKIWAAIHGHR